MPLTEPQQNAVVRLVAVARAAWSLCDNTREDVVGAERRFFPDPSDWDALSDALDQLDLLPDPSPTEVGTGPANAEALLRPLLEVQTPAPEVAR